MMYQIWTLVGLLAFMWGTAIWATNTQDNS